MWYNPTMNLLSVNNIKEFLAKNGAKPLKMMGQNFLIDARALNKIIEASDLGPQDTVLEVGPGMGILTQALSKKVKKVIAIEKDRAMVAILKETLGECENVEIVNGDALKLGAKLLAPNPYKVVANIPYYITSPIIRKFLEEQSQPIEIVLMVQKEVAQRICAKPPHMSILAVSVQFYANAQIISYISKGCFWPVPKVDSAIIKITPFKNKGGVDHKRFFTIVKAGFLQPRKQLANNFSKALKKDRGGISAWLLKNNIQPEQRAETLSIEDWINLAESY